MRQTLFDPGNLAQPYHSINTDVHKRIRDFSPRIRRAGPHFFSSGVSAGPASTSPVGVKRDPWHGQSQVCSARFHSTRQPMCVQIGDSIVDAAVVAAIRRDALAFELERSCLRRGAAPRSDVPSDPTSRSRIM